MAGGLTWSSTCCLRFKFSPEEIEQRYKSQEIDRMLEKDRQILRRQVKLLLLGAGESGKSTFLKQMRIIHGLKFEPEVVKEYRHVIYQNIIKGMKVLVDARDKLNISWQNPKNHDVGNLLLRIENAMTFDAKLFQRYVPSLKTLWGDASIRNAFDRRREFQLVKITKFVQHRRRYTLFIYFFHFHSQSDSVQYFLDSLDRIAREVSRSGFYIRGMRLSIPLIDSI